MHVTAMEKGTAFRVWDGLKLKLIYRNADVVLCLWKQSGIPTNYEVDIAKLNFFGHTWVTKVSRIKQRAWICATKMENKL